MDRRSPRQESLGRQAQRFFGSYRVQRALLPYLLVAPAVLLILSIAIYPAYFAIRLSMMDANLIRFARAEFVGLGNYVDAFNDEIFRGALWRTLRWVLGVSGLTLAIALPSALLLDSSFAGRGAVRSLMLIPWVVPNAVVAIMFRFMVDGNFGVINDLLLRAGLISEYIQWMAGPLSSFWIIVIAQTWTGAPFVTVMLLAGLQAIPGDLYESASSDGANAWQRFRYITFPLLLPTILIVLLLRGIWLSHSVDMIFLMSEGGPAYDNYTLAIYALQLTWTRLEVGYASALAILLSLILLVVSALYIRNIERSREWM